MKKGAKLIHIIGVILFLGSIFTYTLISTLTKNASLTDIVFAREIINTGTAYLTLPGLLIIVLSGIISTIKDVRFLKHRWLNVKFAALLIILLNTFIFILPAADDALELAKASLAEGKLLSEYSAAYMQESIAGGVNVLLAIGSIISGIWKYEKKTTANLQL